MDKYQGQQNDYILLSLVRTRAVGHIRDVRRLVVAMSRSRLGLYVFGRQALFSNCYELQPSLSQFLQRPTVPALHPHEHFQVLCPCFVLGPDWEFKDPPPPSPRHSVDFCSSPAMSTVRCDALDVCHDICEDGKAPDFPFSNIPPPPPQRPPTPSFLHTVGAARPKRALAVAHRACASPP